MRHQQYPIRIQLVRHSNWLGATKGDVTCRCFLLRKKTLLGIWCQMMLVKLCLCLYLLFHSAKPCRSLVTLQVCFGCFYWGSALTLIPSPYCSLNFSSVYFIVKLDVNLNLVGELQVIAGMQMTLPKTLVLYPLYCGFFFCVGFFPNVCAI